MTKRSSPKKAYPPKFCTNRRVSNLAAAGQRQSFFWFHCDIGGSAWQFVWLTFCWAPPWNASVDLQYHLTLFGFTQGELSVAIFTTFNWRPGLSPLPVNIVNFQSDCLQKHTLAFFTKTFFYWALFFCLFNLPSNHSVFLLRGSTRSRFCFTALAKVGRASLWGGGERFSGKEFWQVNMTKSKKVDKIKKINCIFVLVKMYNKRPVLKHGPRTQTCMRVFQWFKPNHVKKNAQRKLKVWYVCSQNQFFSQAGERLEGQWFFAHAKGHRFIPHHLLPEGPDLQQRVLL